MNCPKCDRKFDSQRALNAHLKVHRPGYKSKGSELLEMMATMYGEGLRARGRTDDEIMIGTNAFIAGYEARKPKPRKYANDR